MAACLRDWVNLVTKQRAEQQTNFQVPVAQARASASLARHDCVAYRLGARQPQYLLTASLCTGNADGEAWASGPAAGWAPGLGEGVAGVDEEYNGQRLRQTTCRTTF